MKRVVKRQTGMALILMLSGIMLVAAMLDPGLPTNYWDYPSASQGVSPHDWSKLEADLRPEACAQCHVEQFDAWKNSLHAHAYSPGLVGQFPAMGHINANECLVCHAPLKEQLYDNDESMDASILLRLKHQEGFDRDANLDAEKLPLRHSGVSCAVCHVRGGERFGPPSTTSGAIGKQQTSAHGGFTATTAFEQSQFCASCHQFPQSMAINGKPLENTLTEWKSSSFPGKGVTCQGCHMPDRKHEFRGIHDPDMVRKGLDLKLTQQKNSANLTITSKWIGHAFPTYVTPKVVIAAEAKDAKGVVLKQWQWEVVREVEYNNGWQEVRDTRLMPGESRAFIAQSLPAKAVKIRYWVRVIPDNFYKGIYHSLLEDKLNPAAATHIRRANRQADKNDYLLYEQEMAISAMH